MSELKIVCDPAPAWMLNPQTEDEKKAARVAIARDALLWVRGMFKDVVTPEVKSANVYTWAGDEKSRSVTAGVDDNEEFQGLFAGAKEISVCALGALFMADILRSNSYKVRDGDDRYAIKDRLGRAFTSEEMEDIETVFENVRYSHAFTRLTIPRVPDEAVQATIRKFLEDRAEFEHIDDEEYDEEEPNLWEYLSEDQLLVCDMTRLTCILENIIHNGSFRPELGLAPEVVL